MEEIPIFRSYVNPPHVTMCSYTFYCSSLALLPALPRMTLRLVECKTNSLLSNGCMSKVLCRSMEVGLAGLGLPFIMVYSVPQHQSSAGGRSIACIYAVWRAALQGARLLDVHSFAVNPDTLLALFLTS
eukprot:1291379-Amphidinium_carterae.1